MAFSIPPILSSLSPLSSPTEKRDLKWKQHEGFWVTPSLIAQNEQKEEIFGALEQESREGGEDKVLFQKLGDLGSICCHQVTAGTEGRGGESWRLGFATF